MFNDIGKYDSWKYENSLPLMVWQDGTVEWGFPAPMKTTCKMDVTNFPFDSHDCEIKMYSSSILSLHFDLQPECSEPEILLGYYEGSPQWEITGSISFFNHKYHEPPVVQSGGNLRNRISGHGIGPIFQKTHSHFQNFFSICLVFGRVFYHNYILCLLIKTV